MDPAAVGITEKKDEEQGIDEQDIFHRVVFVLAALTRGLFKRVLGADDPPFGAVMGNRGDTGGAARTATPGVGSSSTSGMTTVAASAAETPRRCARAVRERAGASPRVRNAASSAGRRTCIHWLALLWPMPNRRPCTTWSAEVLRETSMKNSRSSGVGKGQFL
jgi:hypothetical protein